MTNLINEIWQTILGSDEFVPTNPNAIEDKLQLELLASAHNGTEFDVRSIYEYFLTPAA